MASYPALDVVLPDHSALPDHGFLLAALDDYSPVAVEEHPHFVTIYFADAGFRDRALAALTEAFPSARLTARGVDDGNWARRSQESLGPVTVGRITIAPPWAVPELQHAHTGPEPIVVVILPSMGFGTGHHATTRLCLTALQRVPLNDAFVLDVGTGSGVLALSARALGAREVLGIDNDADAVGAAREDLLLNPRLDRVSLEVCELAAWRAAQLARAPAPQPDVIVANLTGALLAIRSADLLLSSLSSTGSLIVSGFTALERRQVLTAFGCRKPAWEAREDGWGVMLVTLRDVLGRQRVNRTTRSEV